MGPSHSPGKETTMTPNRAALALFVLLFLPTLAAGAPEGKIVIAQGVDPTTLDPQWHEETPAYNVLLNVYDTLLFRDKDLKLIPWLAESWRLVNPTTWEFKIRKGVKFHNGEEVDPDAGEPPRAPRGHHAARPLPREGQGLRRSESGRQRPVQVRAVGEGRADRARGQPGLVGRRAQDQDDRVPSDPRARGPRGRAPGGRDRRRGQHPAAPGPDHREAPEALYLQGAERPDDLYPDLRIPVRHREQARGPGGGADARQACAA